MAKKNIPSKPLHKKNTKGQNLFDKVTGYKNKIQPTFLLIFFLLLTLVIDIISFNMKISEAHDDALYIEAAYRLIHEFPSYFYTANAPLYPLFLSFLMKIFGFKIILFKSFNVIFHLLIVWFSFRTFYSRINFLIFLVLMTFVSINYLMVYFSSMTFTELMFMTIQAVLVFYTYKLIDKQQNKETITYLNIIAIVFFVFLLNITRNISIAITPAILIFFALLLKDKKKIAVFIASYFAFFALFKILIRVVWSGVSGNNQYASQSNILLQKDPYDASQGYDSFFGFVERFLGNSELYFSKRMFQALGFMSENNINTYSLVAVLAWGLLFWLIYQTFKKQNHHFLFLAIYTTCLLGITFFVLQTRWDQPRFILVALPYLIILFFNFLLNTLKNNFLKNITAILILTLMGSLVISSFKRAAINYPIFQHALKGDIYYGYTPDWQNFLKCSAWCADSLPPSSFVASRKAPMSFVYAKGKRFFPIYSVIKKDTETNQSNPDSALAFFKQNGVTHILLASLRIDPTKNTGQVINTMHNIVQPIYEKYPKKLKLIHVEGEAEQCYLYQIIYDGK